MKFGYLEGKKKKNKLIFITFFLSIHPLVCIYWKTQINFFLHTQLWLNNNNNKDYDCLFIWKSSWKKKYREQVRRLLIYHNNTITSVSSYIYTGHDFYFAYRPYCIYIIKEKIYLCKKKVWTISWFIYRFIFVWSCTFFPQTPPVSFFIVYI